MTRDPKARHLKTRDPMATVRNALENASRMPVSDETVVAILATGDGPGHLVRALFGDCTFETLDRLGTACGIPRATIRQAYASARQKHAAVNEELEADARRPV